MHRHAFLHWIYIWSMIGKLGRSTRQSLRQVLISTIVLLRAFTVSLIYRLRDLSTIRIYLPMKQKIFTLFEWELFRNCGIELNLTRRIGRNYGRLKIDIFNCLQDSQRDEYRVKKKRWGNDVKLCKYYSRYCDRRWIREKYSVYYLEQFGPIFDGNNRRRQEFLKSVEQSWERFKVATSFFVR